MSRPITSSEYNAVHRRMSRKYGTPLYCEFCLCYGEGHTYEWAHKHDAPMDSQQEFFIRACKKCHIKYDGGPTNKHYFPDPQSALDKCYAAPGKHTFQHKQNIGLGVKGLKRSEETKARMSAAAKERWRRERTS